MSVRVPEECPSLYHSQSGLRHCQLIDELLAVSDPGISLVNPDACEACCRSFLPTVEDLNPVLASLIWSRTSRLIHDANLTVDSPLGNRLVSLREFAEASLPLLVADADDLPISNSRLGAISKRRVDDIEKKLPRPEYGARKISEWAIGITTAPRRQPTIDQCVRSVINAGWEAPHLFIDGDVEISDGYKTLKRTTRSPAAGAWKSFYLSLVELARRSTADGIMLVQDDALWPSHLPIREYLERIAWPSDGRFIISPYCCADYTSNESGWRQFEGTWEIGAVAFIFSRVSAEEFVSDQRIISYSQKQSASIDTIVGEWAVRNQIPVFVPTPSLVQHIGDISTLWRTSRAAGFRRASRYVGDEIPPIDEEMEYK